MSHKILDPQGIQWYDEYFNLHICGPNLPRVIKAIECSDLNFLSKVHAYAMLNALYMY